MGSAWMLQSCWKGMAAGSRRSVVGGLWGCGLEGVEVSEKADNAVKFLSDMYYARVYKLAAARIGVPDYRILVEEKLRTAGELYRFLMDEFHQARAFLLEFVVVVILMI